MARDHASRGRKNLSRSRGRPAHRRQRPRHRTAFALNPGRTRAMYIVTAQQQIPLSVHEVWDYLTRPELLSSWFGDTSHLGPGEHFRMDFGDGDFLSGRVIE